MSQEFVTRRDAADPTPEPGATPSSGQAQVDDLDALLDEIDEVIAQTPQDYVRSYVQKGGQ